MINTQIQEETSTSLYMKELMLRNQTKHIIDMEIHEKEAYFWRTEWVLGNQIKQENVTVITESKENHMWNKKRLVYLDETQRERKESKNKKSHRDSSVGIWLQYLRSSMPVMDNPLAEMLRQTPPLRLSNHTFCIIKLTFRKYITQKLVYVMNPRLNKFPIQANPPPRFFSESPNFCFKEMQIKPNRAKGCEETKPWCLCRMS